MFIVAQANAAHSDIATARDHQRWSPLREHNFRLLRALVRRNTRWASVDVGPTVQAAPSGNQVAIVATRTANGRDRFWPAAAQNGASMRAVRPLIQQG